VSFELGRALLLMETITPAVLADALLLSAREGVSLVRALILTRAIEPERLEQELSRTDAPSVRAVHPAHELMERLPGGLCVRMLAVPIRKDPRTGTVDVVVPDLRDAHGAQEIGFHLGAAVRPIRAPLTAIERALTGPAMPRISAPPPTGAPTPPWGMPSTDRATQEIPIPLTSRKRSITPPAVARRGPWVLQSDEIVQGGTPAGDLVSAVESAVKQVADAREARTREPSTLIPPPNLSVPPPPNTERRPPQLSSHPPPPSSDERASVPSFPPPGGPIVDPGPVLPDAGSVIAAIRTAKSRDAVLQLLIVGTRSVARKVALFIVRREAFVGWACTPEFGEVADLRTVIVAADAPSALATAATNGSYLGPIVRSGAHELILDIMGTATKDVAIWPVRVFGRPTVMIMADELGDTMIATRRMEELAATGGDALARIVRERAEVRY
jgi:hypothetical protein